MNDALFRGFVLFVSLNKSPFSPPTSPSSSPSWKHKHRMIIILVYHYLPPSPHLNQWEGKRKKDYLTRELPWARKQNNRSDKSQMDTLIYFYLFIIFFCLFRATPMPYEGSQARGLIGAVVTGLRQSHSNAGSEPHL